MASQTDIKLTAKMIFTEAGKPLLKEVSSELGKDGIIGGLEATKIALEAYDSRL